MISVSGADAASSFTVTLTINPIAISTYSYTSPSLGPLTVPIGRYISFSQQPPLTSRWFASNSVIPSPNFDYAANDTDETVYNTIVRSGQGYAYVILYALTYGFEAGTSIVQYSTATYLGYVQITFP